MKKHILAKTNIFICIIIIIGYLITSFVSYNSNHTMLKKDIEHISDLSSESIYHKIDSLFTKPINISLTMANDTFLMQHMKNENALTDDANFVKTITDYLHAYKVKYNFDSVFLVSTKTKRYYHFDGIDRILTKDNPENTWYYEFLNSKDDYSINIDNDEAKKNEITVFINCKLKDVNKHIIGVIGVGFRIEHLQELLKQYEKKFNVKAFLIDANGTIQLSTNISGYQKQKLAQNKRYETLLPKLMKEKEESVSFWYSEKPYSGYLIRQPLNTIQWQLLIDRDTAQLEHSMHQQLGIGFTIILMVIILVLGVITYIVRKYNKKLIHLTLETEMKHQSIFQQQTEQIYDTIYEIDVTHNCAASEATEDYFYSQGIPRKTPYDESLKIIAEKQIKPEFRAGYLTVFDPAHILQLYEEGITSTQYDFMINNGNDNNYYWMRITVKIFYWDDDQSIRMFVYRQNIDEEKRKELFMKKKMESDSLTSLYNKAATRSYIQQKLMQNTDQYYAFYILDIDNFKDINDAYGHAVGDEVIVTFANILKNQFPKDTIIGRIGGDEFVTLQAVASKQEAQAKAEALVNIYHNAKRQGLCHYTISASIGVAVTIHNLDNFDSLYHNADKALYEAKENGKNQYRMYEK